METKKIIERFKARTLRKFEADLDEMLEELTTILSKEVEAEHLAIIDAALLPKRKKLAETEEVAFEKGMTLEEIRIHNAEAEGYNERSRKLRKQLLGEEVVEVEAPEVAPAPAVTPEVVAEPTPEEPVV